MPRLRKPIIKGKENVYMKTTTSTISNSINNSLLRCGFIIMPFVLMCVATLPGARAVSPPPDGGYPGGNTAEGTDALLSLSSGTNNTAIGADALANNVSGNDNTAVGFQALLLATGHHNTAVGFQALLNNTIGILNTAIGAFSLSANIDGRFNTAVGGGMEKNTSG